MISSPSRSENTTPSITARVMWPRPWRTVSPTNAPRACGSRCGVRSRSGTGGTPGPRRPGATPAASFTSVSKSSPPSVSRHQRSEPPADSVTAITWYAPGQRVAEGVDAARRVGGEARRSGRTRTPLVPIELESWPSRGHADADRRRRVVAAARRHRQPAGSPSSAAIVVAHRARLLRALVDAGQPLARDLQRRQQQRPTSARSADVEQQRARGVGGVGRLLAGQPQAHVVLRQQHRCHARVVLGLVRRAATGSSGPGSRSAPGCRPRSRSASAPTRSVISSHWRLVRWSFHSSAGRITSSPPSRKTEPCIWPVSPRPAISPSTLRRDRAQHLAAAAHQSSGCCSVQPGRGVSSSYPPRPRRPARPSPRRPRARGRRWCRRRGRSARPSAPQASRRDVARAVRRAVVLHAGGLTRGGSQMRAVVIPEVDKIEIATIDDPTPGARDVVVAVAGCGICGTDLHILQGEFAPTLPIVPGPRVRRRGGGGRLRRERGGGRRQRRGRPDAQLRRVPPVPARALQPVRALAGDRGQRRRRGRRVRARARGQLRDPARGREHARRGADRAAVVRGARLRRAADAPRRPCADLRLGNDGADDAPARQALRGGDGRRRRPQPRSARDRAGAGLQRGGHERRRARPPARLGRRDRLHGRRGGDRGRARVGWPRPGPSCSSA